MRSLSFIRRLASRLRSRDSFRDVGSQSGVSIPNSINRRLSSCVMLFLPLARFKHRK